MPVGIPVRWHRASLHRAIEDGIEIVADDWQAGVRLLTPQRPFADEFVDFRVELQDLGLNTATVYARSRVTGPRPIAPAERNQYRPRCSRYRTSARRG